jgi:hypothetical protein
MRPRARDHRSVLKPNQNNPVPEEVADSPLVPLPGSERPQLTADNRVVRESFHRPTL